MATLAASRFNFEPDIHDITAQCSAIAQNAPHLTTVFDSAIRNLSEAVASMQHGDLAKAAQILEKALCDVIETGANELVASCFYYLWLLAITIGDEDISPRLIDSALSRTENPLMRLSAYNRLMIHFLDKNDCDSVTELAKATKELIAQLPASDNTGYYHAAASYNTAEAVFRRGDYSSVPTHAETAAKKFESLGLRPESAKSRGLWGYAMVLGPDTDTGCRHLDTALAIFRELHNDSEVAFLLQGRGIAMAKLGDRTQAVRELREALRIFKQRRDTNGINKTRALLCQLEPE